MEAPLSSLLIKDIRSLSSKLFFSLTYWSLGGDLRSRFLPLSLDTSCGGVHEDGSGTISSPGYPNGYSINLDCVWLVYRTKETAEFIFINFETESNYDIVAISSGRWAITNTLKWICDHPSESQFKQVRFFFRAIFQLLKLQFTAMITYSFHLYSRSSRNFILNTYFISCNCEVENMVLK